MSNELFAQYTTSVAFCLQLSKLQCHMILAVKDGHYSDWVRASFMGTLQSLERKGIVHWNRDESGEAHGFGGLTEAGEHLAKLLVIAGLTLENTATNSTLRHRAA